MTYRDRRREAGTHPFAASCRSALTLAIVASLLAGCRGAGSADSASAEQRELTFSHDIRPILERHCASCHQPGQAAPFPLLSYGDVQPRATRIADATRARVMPPWLPEGEFGEFVGDRRMTDADIQVIQEWVRQGSVEGEAMPPISVRDTAGWTLGEPDLVVAIPRPYTLAPHEHDVFRNFVFPVERPDGAFVKALEFRTGRTRAIHHAMISVDQTHASRRKDGLDGVPGYGGMFTQGAQSPDGHFLGWTPGRGPIVSPKDLPWRLERGSDLVVQLHLLPGDAPETIAPSVGLYFSDTPPLKTPVMVRLGSKAIDIPPGEANYAIEDSYVLPVDVELLSVYPHAHYLGREMQCDAILPDGRRIPLLRIPRWDFHWQQDYRYTTPRVLPRGTILWMRYTYDNSGGHSHGSNHAPRRVLYGPESHDEMGDLWLQVLPRMAADADVLRRALQQREVMVNIAGGEILVQRAPDVAGHYVFLGNAYLDAGRVDDAIRLLQTGVRLDGKSADAHNGLASALFMAGRRQESIAHFASAAKLDPADDRLFFNLGSALMGSDRGIDAEAAFRRAVAINPDFAEAHNNLGILMQSAGRFFEAIRHFERAVASNPDYADAYNNLGAALASQGRWGEAASHFRKAVELSPAHGPAQENLRAVSRDP